MKKAISYLYREILLKVNEELNSYDPEEYKDEEERVKEALDEFKQQFQDAKIADVDEFDEELCYQLYKSTRYYSWIGDMDIVREVINEFRESGEEIDDKVEQDRYYCYQDVSRKITGLDDLYLGWTYYFGGGKYGEPEEVEWMEDCYLLKCKEVEETRIVKVYEKVEE